MTTARKASYLLFGLLAAGVIVLRMGQVALAGLFSYMILDLGYRRLVRRLPETPSRWLSLAAFIVIAALVSWLIWAFVRMALLRLPEILASMLPRVQELAAARGLELPFENLHELRAAIIEALKDNFESVTHASGLLTRGFFQLVVGVFVAVLCFMSGRAEPSRATLFDAIRREFDDRMDVFMDGFEKVFGAQVLISFINTGVTAIFIIAVGVPFVHFLTLATFLFGVIPIVGTVISNTLVVGTALTISTRLAFITFVFLILMHKAQYFLSSQIMGSRTNMPVWQVLLGILVGEALLGVPGMLLAPAILNYVREELQALPAKGERG